MPVVEAVQTFIGIANEVEASGWWATRFSQGDLRRVIQGDRGAVAPQFLYVALARAKQRVALLTAA